MRARLDRDHLLLACAVGAVAILVWRTQRRARAAARGGAGTALAEARRAVPPPADADEAALRLSDPAAPRTPWLQRASVAIHLGQPHELANIARELEAAGYPAVAGLLGNYTRLLERPRASRSRILVEVTRLLATGLAEPPIRSASARPRRGAAGSPHPCAAGSFARARAALRAR